MKYAVIGEAGEHNYSAYVPDLPGCIATGKTVEEVTQLIQEAIALHLEGLREDGDPIPEPMTLCAYEEAMTHGSLAGGPGIYEARRITRLMHTSPGQDRGGRSGSRRGV